MKDVLGRPLIVGAKVAVAFKWGTSGEIRIGIIELLENECTIRVRWDADDKLSPLMNYIHPHRWLRI